MVGGCCYWMCSHSLSCYTLLYSRLWSLYSHIHTVRTPHTHHRSHTYTQYTSITYHAGYAFLFYFIHRRKRNRASSQRLFLLDNFESPGVEANDYFLDPSLRISDGQSNSSDTDSILSLLSQERSDSDSDRDDQVTTMTPSPTPPSASGMHDSDIKPADGLEGQPSPHWTLPLAPRQNPDGCSISSSSSDNTSTESMIPLLRKKY